MNSDCHSVALTVTWTPLSWRRRGACHLKYKIGPSPDPWEGPSAVSSRTSPIIPYDLGVTQAAWSLLGSIREVPALVGGQGFRSEGSRTAQRAPPLGLPDLANENTGHPAEVEFQTDMNSFSVCLWATVHRCQAGGPGDNSRFCWLIPRGGDRGGEGAGHRAEGPIFPACVCSSQSMPTAPSGYKYPKWSSGKVPTCTSKQVPIHRRRGAVRDWPQAVCFSWLQGPAQ